MTFANPLGLIGLLSLPVIIALHLIRERSHRFVVSSLGLWSFLDDQVRGPRPRRIPLTWLLILDLAAAALFSLALARPQLKITLPALGTPRHHVILMDVSTSMRAQAGLMDRFSQAKAEAAALLENTNPRDVVTVVTFGRSAHWVGDSRQEDFPTLNGLLQALQAGETANQPGGALQEALVLGAASLDPHLPAEFHILTDGAFSNETTAGVDGLGYPVQWHFFGGVQGNQAVLELNATPLGSNRYQVFTRIANFDHSWVVRSVSLQGDGRTIDTTRVEIPAESTLPQVWEISGSYRSVAVSVSGQDGLQQDNAAVIGLQPAGKVRVALVAEEPAPLQQALQAVPEVDLQVIPPQDYMPQGMEPAPDLTIFRGFLPQNWPGGAVLILEPPDGTDGGSDPLVEVRNRQEIAPGAPLQFPTPDPLLTGVDFNGVRWSRALTLSAIPSGFVTLLQAGDLPLLLRGERSGLQEGASGPTQIWVLLADLKRGNFTKHPAFPILMAKFALGAKGAPLNGSIHTGQALALPLHGGSQALRIISPGGEPADFRGEWPSLWEGTLEPGLYRVILEDANGEDTEFITGVQAGDAAESDLRPRPWAQAAGRGEMGSDPAVSPETPASAAGDRDRPLDLVPWLMAAALITLLVEAALAWK